MTHRFSRGKNDAVVMTTKGRVRGYCYDGLQIFKGIPYAKARRFHAPEPVEPWEGILDASSYGMVCPLLKNERPNGELIVPHRYWPMDEDCQNLNIWTPAADDKKRPVLVWFHGGGFSAGSSIEQVAYDGANMSRLGDVVVVSINHRLNILGYLDLSEYGREYANSANAGNDDIVASLAWVHENIAAFGGDPENVTLFGQSGGGGKVTAMLQTPAADGLYAKGVVMSGVLGKLMVDRPGSAKPLVEAMLGELKLDSVQQMETVPYFLLAQAYNKISPALDRAGEYVGCLPRKNAFYCGDSQQWGFRKKSAHIPLVVGSVFGEFAPFTGMLCDRESVFREEQIEMVRKALGRETADNMLALFAEAYPERHPIDLLHMDFLFRSPEIGYLAERSKLNDCTWSYLFNMDQPIEGGSTPWHCCDIPYFFHNVELVEYPNGETKPENLAQRMEEQMFGLLMAFARTGNPQTDKLPSWKPVQEGREYTLVLDANTRVLENFDHKLISEAFSTMAESFAKAMQEHREEVQH